MIGGGAGGFIGGVHRMAANLDGQLELVCGAFSSDPDKGRASGLALGVDAARCYPDFATLVGEEQALSAGQRMDFVVIVTPNHLHFPAAKAALEGGFHVVSDKPATVNYDEALQLQDLVAQTGLLYALTHNYTGYPMVRHARALVQEGALGTIRKVLVDYWMGGKARGAGAPSGPVPWRMDPAKAGPAGCLGDIGSHAENLATFITGLRLESVAADLTCFGQGAVLDDDAAVLLRYESGAKGILQSSKIAVGEKNNLKICIYGERAGLEWHQIEPNTLWFKPQEGPAHRLRTGVGPLSPEARAATRIPAGHPEGYLEAFANIYRGITDALWARINPEHPRNPFLSFPSIEEAVSGMAFIEAVVASSAENGAWKRVS